MLYGNYAEKPKIAPNTDTSFKSPGRDPNKKFTKLKAYNYAQKLANISGMKSSNAKLSLIERAATLKTQPRIQTSLEVSKPGGKDTSMPLISSTKSSNK